MKGESTIEWNGENAIYGFAYTFDFLQDMARRDGFESVKDMIAWFRENHPKPKKMVVIQWKLEPPEATE